jgi:predicted metal-dependent peptidase
MEIDNIVKNLLIRYPLFGNIIANLNFVYTNSSVPAPAYTDGANVYYKQEFLDEFTNEEKEFIIAHELFHIVLSHLSRNIGRDRDLLNYVEDAIINQLLARDGLIMPQGLVDVSDALDYSTDELYMRFLPQLEEIKKWMKSNTYHLEIKDLNDILNKMYDADMQDLMDENSKLRNEMISDYQEELKGIAQQSKEALGMAFPSVEVGKAAPLLHWKDILRASLVNPSESITSFYEVEMDGVIRKELKQDTSFSESEIVIDSSGSMNMQKIKAILRECKNILSCSDIRVGFCDTKFYGWNDIRNDADIDKLHIIGRGGTDFETMAKTFSSNVDNKIVLTDGWGTFPLDRPDVLWIVIDYQLPYHLDSNASYGGWLSKQDISKINFIFINENEIEVPNNVKRLSLKKN